MDSLTTLSVSPVVTLGLYSLTAMNGTLGLLSSVLDADAELNVSKPPKAIPFLRFSTASRTVFAPSKYKYNPLGMHNTKCAICCSSVYANSCAN